MSTALYTPTPAAAEGSNLGAFARFVAAQHPNVLPQPLTYDAAGYAALHNWSVTSPNAFWGALWSFCKLEGTLTGADQVFLDESAQMRDIPSWMPGATLNYAQNMLRHAKQQPDAIALTSIYENPSHTPRYVFLFISIFFLLF
jgi:acetoacetyl-CoA synthetase